MPSAPVPRNPVNVSIRPLVKGMITDQPSDMLPMGAFLDIQNAYVKPQGLERRGGYVTYGTAVDYPPIQGMMSLWKTDGTLQTVIIDQKFMYTITSTGPTGVYDTYTTGTVANTAAAVTGVGTGWDSADVQAGDVIIFDPAGTPVEAIILSQANDTTITLTADPGTDHGGGTSYEIRRAFKAPVGNLVDWTITNQNKIIFTDGVRTPRSYDGTTFGEYDSKITEIMDVIEYFADRLWGGRVVASSVNYRYRIIWTSTTDLTDFTPSAADLSLDLPYQSGRIRYLKGLGDYLVAYFEDTIYIGRRTNIGSNTLPFAFVKLQTTNSGLVGIRAIDSWTDGHFFIGQDDVYFLSNQFALTPLKSPVRFDLLANKDSLWKAYVETDPRNELVKFGIPGSSGDLEKLWTFNYKTKAWSYDVFTSTMLTNQELVETTTWDGAASTWDSHTESWNSHATGVGDIRFWTAQLGSLFYLDNTANQDPSSVPISMSFTTGDFDYDNPDKLKSHQRFNIRIKEAVSQDLIFVVQGSNDQGNTFKSLGSLIISSGDVEGYINFSITGAATRFKVTCGTVSVPYVITGLTLRVVGRGLESKSDN